MEAINDIHVGSKGLCDPLGAEDEEAGRVQHDSQVSGLGNFMKTGASKQKEKWVWVHAFPNNYALDISIWEITQLILIMV
jgi:hypothetical protein